MNIKPTCDTEDRSHGEASESELSEDQWAAQRDPEKQRAYEDQYRLQLRRRLCPGCGETDGIPF